TQGSTLPRLTEGNYLIRIPFETVVVADDEEWIEILDAADLLGQIPSSLLVHVGRRLVEERDVDFGKLFQQRQPHRQRGGHLLPARQVQERAFASFFLERDLVILGPLQRHVVAARDLAEQVVGLDRNREEVGFGDVRRGLLQDVADEIGSPAQ